MPKTLQTVYLGTGLKTSLRRTWIRNFRDIAAWRLETNFNLERGLITKGYNVPGTYFVYKTIYNIVLMDEYNYVIFVHK